VDVASNVPTELFVGAQSSVLVFSLLQILRRDLKTPQLSNRFELKADS
jgi:hypothetical protein